jgi:hypothetical protein
MGMFPTHNHSERSKYSDFTSIMSSISYYLQIVVLCSALLWFFSRKGKIDRFVLYTVVLWAIGVSLIYFRYGPIGQWSFYQNDQYWHWKIVAQLIPQGINFLSVDQLNLLRIPYALPAYLMSTVGFDVTLSLKFVSLVSLVLTHKIANDYLSRFISHTKIKHLWFLTSPFLIFFSMLALRETTMALFVAVVFFLPNPTVKICSLFLVGFLRPHLAVAILFGFVWGWLVKRAPRSWYFATVAASALIPIWVGTLGFSVGSFLLNNLPLQLYQDFFLKSQITQVFSSFVGLQFLTVADQTIEYTTQSILLIRLIFPEIVLVPLLFTSTLLVYKQELTQLKLTIFSAFVFFVAVSSGTEFLSVRQTLPFFPILAVVVIRTYAKEAVAKPEELTASRVTN